MRVKRTSTCRLLYVETVFFLSAEGFNVLPPMIGIRHGASFLLGGNIHIGLVQFFILAVLDFLLFGSSTVSCEDIDFFVAASFTTPGPFLIQKKNI